MKCIFFTVQRTFPDDPTTYYLLRINNDELWVEHRQLARKYASVESAHADIARLLDQDPTHAPQFEVNVMVVEIPDEEAESTLADPVATVS